MKNKFSKFLLVSFLAVAGIFGVSSALINKQLEETQVAKKTDATTEEHGGICLIVEDQISEWAKWTYYESDGNQRNAYAKLTSIVFDDDSICSSASDLTSAMFQSVPYDTRGFDFSVSGSTVYVSMFYQGSCNSGHGRKYCLALPWVIKSCTVSYYGHKSNDLTQYTLAQNGGSNPYTVSATRGNSYGCYIYDRSGDGWSGNTFYGIISSTTGSFSYDITTYSLTYYDNGGEIDVESPETYKQFQKTVEPEATKEGYGLLKWTTDEEGEDIFSFGSSLSEDTDVYAQWATVKTIYYVTNSGDPTGDRIYAWTGDGESAIKEFGNFPGASITSVGTDVTGVVSFEGTYKKIYEIKLISTKFEYANNGGDVQSSEFTVTDGAAYWWTGGANSDAGAAISLIVSLENARNAVSAHGSIKNYSICGIASSTITSLCSTYNSLSAEAKRLVDTSTTYTYDGASSSQTNVSFSAIFAQLSKMSGAKGLYAMNPFSNLFGASEEGFSTVIIIVSSGIALLSITALSILVIKKRKQKEE